MLKKFIALLLSIVLLFALSTVAYAQSPDVVLQNESAQSDIMPCFEYINTTYTLLSISSDGTATCLATLSGYNGVTTKIEIKMTLQKKTLFWWSEVDSWTKTVNDSQCSFKKTASIDGGTYRVKAEFTVYSGSNREETTSYSSEKEH